MSLKPKKDLLTIALQQRGEKFDVMICSWHLGDRTCKLFNVHHTLWRPPTHVPPFNPDNNEPKKTTPRITRLVFCRLFLSSLCSFYAFPIYSISPAVANTICWGKTPLIVTNRRAPLSIFLLIGLYPRPQLRGAVFTFSSSLLINMDEWMGLIGSISQL